MNTVSEVQESVTAALRARLTEARDKLTTAKTGDTRSRAIEKKIEELIAMSDDQTAQKTKLKNLAAAARDAKRRALDITSIEAEASKMLPDFIPFGMSLSDGTRKACDVGSRHGPTGAVISETSGGESAAILGALATVFVKRIGAEDYALVDLPDVSWHPLHLQAVMESLSGFAGQVIICSTVLPGDVVIGEDDDGNTVSVTYVTVPESWTVVNLDEMFSAASGMEEEA